MDRTLEELASIAQACPEEVIDRTHSMDFDMVQSEHICRRVREDRVYAQNLYAAMCNTEWQEQDTWQILSNKTWACSWRTAGGIVADILGEGDYMDWYCSGMFRSHPDDDLGDAPGPDIGHVREGEVTDEIRRDLLDIGWCQVVDQY